MANIAFSSSLNMIWSLVHCLQIVAFFPLNNVLMPANAHQVFQLILQIANFEMFPVEDMIEETEKLLGLQNDGYLISENFGEFDYNSTNIIDNLEVIFIFFLALLALPFIALLLYALFFWSAKCVRL